MSVLTVGPPDVDGAGVAALACPTVSKCTTLAEGGQEATFDPTSSSTPATAQIDSGAYTAGGLACPETDQCTTMAN